MESNETFQRMTVPELRTIAKSLVIFNRVLAELRAEHTQDQGRAGPM